MINLRLVSDLHRQHSIVEASFSLEQKRHAFKRHLEANKLLQLRIHLGRCSSSKTTDRYTPLSTQAIGNIFNPLEVLTPKGVAQYIPKKNVLNPLSKGIREINCIKFI